MPKKDDFGLSRSSRKKEQRFDRFLNWAIVVVVVCILVVGGYLLVSILNTPDQPAAEKQQTTQNNGSAKENDSAKDTESTKQNDDQVTNDDETNNNDNNAVTEDDQSSENQDDDASKTDEGSYDTSDGGPSGPWNPIGTTQSEPHTKSYDMRSVDWKEQVKALSYATGIPEDQMTVKWLGNGGAPDKSLGKVYAKQDSSKVYDVIIQWVPNQGWQPISVNVE